MEKMLAVAVCLCGMSILAAESKRFTYLTSNQAPGPCTYKPNTYYVIKSDGGVGALASSEDNAYAINTVETDSNFERWSFRQAPFAKFGAAVYALVNKENGLALTVPNKDNEKVTLSKYNGIKSQLFHIVAKNDKCVFQSLETKLYLSSEGTPTDILPIFVKQRKADDPNPSSQWSLKEVACDPHPNQAYQLVHRISGLVVGVPGGGTKDGNAIKVLDKNEKEDYAQVTFEHTGEKKFRIRLRHSGFSFDVKGAVGTGVFQAPDDNDNGNFAIEAVLGGYCVILDRGSDHYLAVKPTKGPTYQVGDQLVRMYETYTENSHFTFKPISFLPDPNTGYLIKNRASGKALEVGFSSQVPGAAILQFQPTFTPNQVWFFAPVAKTGNRYRLRAQSSNLSIEIDSDAGVRPAYQQPQKDLDRQQFAVRDGTMRAESSSYFKLQSFHNKLVLSPLYERTDDHFFITATNANASSVAQEWEIMPEF